MTCGVFDGLFKSMYSNSLFLCRSLLEELFPLFLSNLEDSIPSVRQGAAVALVQLYTAYGEYFFSEIALLL